MVLVLSSISGTKHSPFLFYLVLGLHDDATHTQMEWMPSKIYSEVCLSILSESQLRKTDNKNEPSYIVSKELCTFWREWKQ